MTYSQAAVELLKEAGEPVHYKQLALRAIERGLIEPKGQTPEMTMGSQLYVLARKAADGADVPAVRSVGGGLFELGRPALSTRLDDEIERNNSQVKTELLENLREIDPRQLEHLVAQLLQELGYEDVEVTQYVGDEGIDVTATLTAGGVASVVTAVQVKRHTANIGRETVQKLRGSLSSDQRGLVITTGGYTAGAKTEAEAQSKLPIGLVNGERLAALMVEHGIGVTRRTTQVLELDLDSLVTPVEEPHSGRSPTLWPLPGGQKAFYDSLLVFLDRIGQDEEGITLEALTAWAFETFEKVTKKDVVNSYLRSVLASMRLVKFEGEFVMLSELGAELRADRSKDALLVVLREQILGVEELLGMLGQGANDLNALNTQLCAQIGRTWETTTQTKYRLTWLANAGAVEQKAGKWHLLGEVPPLTPTVNQSA